jgi:hypothetical protein
MWPQPDPISRNEFPSSTWSDSKHVAYICGADILNPSDAKRRGESCGKKVSKEIIKQKEEGRKNLIGFISKIWC